MPTTISDGMRRIGSQAKSMLEDNLISIYQRDEVNACQPNTGGLIFRIADSLSRTWHLGFTAFGGPPVHFQILYGRFVEPRDGKVPWADEQTVSDAKQNLSSRFLS